MYTKHFNVRKTSQREAIPGRIDMVKNNAGGFGFSIGDWARLDRFLISGSADGTFYVKEKKLTLENADAVLRCIAEDGQRVVHTAVHVSVDGRAPKNNPAIFALALCVAFGDTETKSLALSVMKDVCRIGTHLFTFAQYLRDLNVGWSRSVRRAFAQWYNTKDANFAAYQVLKYQRRTVYQKDKSSVWSHKDILRLAHPAPVTQGHSDVFNWAINGWDGDNVDNALAQIMAYEAMKEARTEKTVIELIQGYNLTREMVPTTWLNSINVWEALLARMPMTAMVRNLGKMSNIGLVKTFSNAEKVVVKKLASEEYIKKSRLHPLSILVALRTYVSGAGKRGSLTWTPSRAVVDALDNAFYMSFNNVTPTNKNLMLALDVSGSMDWNEIAGMPITPREASAAMAMITARVEPSYMVTAFTSGRNWQSDTHISEVPISPRQRLDDVVGTVWNMRAGGTDCALPMLYAQRNKIPVDAFIIYTDNESWAGKVHATQALQMYRKAMGIDAKLIAVAMYATDYSVADPRDPKQMDVVGFDTATPNIMSEFIRG